MFESKEPLMQQGGTFDAITPSNRKIKRVFSIPKSVNCRLKAVIEAERRTQTVVMERIIKDYLAKTDNEPRPYVPVHYEYESSDKLTLLVFEDDYVAMDRRARYEGRQFSVVMLRAVLDYLEVSPDDPVKRIVAESTGPTVGPESESTGTIDGSESAPEEGSE